MLTKKDQILEVSTHLFRHQGYSATSMQDIAQKLGIKPASLYNHIIAKQDILVELLEKGATMFLTGMAAVKTSSLTSYEKIEKLISLHIQLTVTHTDLMALMAVEWRHLEGDPKAQYVGHREKYEEDFRQILAAAIEEKSIQAVNPEIALFAILTTLQRLYAWYDRHSDLNVFDMEKHLIQCLLGGIRA